MQVLAEPRAPEVESSPAGPSRRRGRGITFEQLALGALFVMLFARASQAPAQNDTWWHLRAGRDIWQGIFPTVERWSFTARGHPWPDHEWLSEAIFYALHRVGGMPLLAVAVAVAVTAAFALVWQLMFGPVLRRGALVFLTLPVTLIVASLRPQVFSLLLLAVTVTLLARRRFAWLPVVFLLWANLHGAVVMGGLVVVAVLVAAFVWERRYARSLAVCAAVSGVAVFLTPLGTGILGLVFGMSNEADISEWEPAWRNLPAGAVFGVVVVVAVAAVVALRRRRPFAWSDRVLVASAAGLVLPAVRYSRLMPMFVVVALPLIARGWEAWRPSTARVEDRSVVNGVLLAVVVVAAVAWVGAAWAGPSSALAWEPLPAAAVTAVRACHGPVYNRFDDGAYLLWFAPGVPVFIDSRVDPYPDRLLRDHIHDEATGDYRATFARYGIECALLPPVSATARHLLHDGWAATYDDGSWLVLQPG
jgi:MFS family permease